MMHSKVECVWIQVKRAVHNGSLVLKLSAHKLEVQNEAQGQAFLYNRLAYS